MNKELCNNNTKIDVEITAVAFSPNGEYVAGASKDEHGKVRISIWNIRSGNQVQTLEHNRYDEIKELVYAPNGEFLAIATKRVSKIFRLADGECTVTCDSYSEHPGIAYSPDGLNFAYGHTSDVVVCDAQSGEFIKSLSACFGELPFVTEIAYSPCGKYLACGVQGRTMPSVCVWEINKGYKEIRLKEPFWGPRTIAFSPNSKYLFTGGMDEGIGVWKLGSQKYAGGWATTDNVYALAHPKDKDFFVAACGGQGIDIITYHRRWFRWDVQGRVLNEPCTMLDISVDGKYLVYPNPSGAGIRVRTLTWQGGEKLFIDQDEKVLIPE